MLPLFVHGSYVPQDEVLNRSLQAVLTGPALPLLPGSELIVSPTEKVPDMPLVTAPPHPFARWPLLNHCQLPGARHRSPSQPTANRGMLVEIAVGRSPRARRSCARTSSRTSAPPPQSSARAVMLV